MTRLPQLTRPRILLALAVAVSADAAQWLLNAPGWAGPDQLIDIAAMLATWRLIGFHWLLLPSFALELVPVADDLPTWTACVVAVIILRRRQQRAAPPLLPPGKPPIDA